MASRLSLCIHTLVFFICHQHLLNINTSVDGFLIARLNVCIPCFYIIIAIIIINGFSVCSQFTAGCLEWRGYLSTVRLSDSSFPLACLRFLYRRSEAGAPGLRTVNLW